MKRQHERITPDRLIDGSIAILRALAELKDELAGTTIFPPDLMGSPLQPACLCEFSKFEVEEATAFLIRMGMIEKATGPKS